MRVAHREVSVADIAVYHEIHKVGTMFQKARWYQKLSPRQYDDETCAVFGIRDQRKAAARRKLFLQAGSVSSVREWETGIVNIVDLMVARVKQELDERGKADVTKWFSYMTCDVLGLVAFDENFGMIRIARKPGLVEDIETSIILVGLKLELPWAWTIVEWLAPLVPAFRRFLGLFERFEQYADIAVANTKLASESERRTMFSKMVNEGGQQLQEYVIKQEAVNIIIAGTDTTAMTLTCLVYAVFADNRGEIKQRSLEELKTCGDQPTCAELQGKQYLNNVVDETLRLYSPIGGSLPRVPPSEGAVLGQYYIPADTLVMTQSSTFHTNPVVFPDPLKFDPDRWQEPTSEMKQHFMPFGGSSRFCLGQNIARLEILEAAAKLFKACPDMKLAPSVTTGSMKPLEFFVNRPKGIRCEIVPK